MLFTVDLQLERDRVICSICNFQNKAGANFCAKCGSPFASQSLPLITTKTCRVCQFACKPDAKFCPKCGGDFSATSENLLHLQTALGSPDPSLAMPFPAAPILPAEPAPILIPAAIPPEAPALIPPSVVAVVATTALEPCPHCGASVKRTAVFCGKCGKQIPRDTATGSRPFITLPPVVLKTDHSTDTEPTTVTSGGGDSPAPQPGSLPPEPPARPPGQSGRDTESDQKPKVSTKALVIAAGALAAALIAGGAYYALSGKATAKPDVPAANAPAAVPSAFPAVAAPAAPAPTTTNGESGESATATVPAPATVPATPEAPPVVAIPAPVEKPVPAPVVIAEPEAPIRAPKPEKKVKPPAPVAVPRDSTIDGAVAATLTEASQCMARKQYDCVIANANGALRLDKGNTRAQELRRQAKEAQERALSQIQIQ